MSRVPCDICGLLRHLPRRMLGDGTVPEPRRPHMGVTAEKSADATVIRPLTGETPQAFGER
jgi:hypothetical protein